MLLGGVVLHTASITFRGIAIEYFPLTNKFESFTGFALACFSVLLFYSRVESYVYRIATFSVGYIFFVVASVCFSSYLMKVSYAPPLMLTIWYIFTFPYLSTATRCGQVRLQRQWRDISPEEEIKDGLRT